MAEHPVVIAAREAGVVGRGGAGFPTHVKLAGRAEIVIANCCECEPLLYSDAAVMEDHAEALVLGLAAAVSAVGAERGVLAVKRKHGALLARLESLTAESGFELFPMDDFYPAGDEQVLVREVTGRSVPPLGLPSAVDCLVQNAATLVDLAAALDGVPVTSRTLTVTGEVGRPSVFSVPVGTSVRQCIEFCGGTLVADPVVVLGGPMMGRVLDAEDAQAAAVVDKTLSGILVLPRGHHIHATARLDTRVMRRRAAAACIQCRLCSELCPRTLLGHPFATHKVMRAFALGGELTLTAARQALLCCGCGVCEHVACPMGLSPCTVNSVLKKAFAESKITFSGDRELCRDGAELREYRKVPTARLAARVGISRYMKLRPEKREGFEPEEVRIPLRQHIGLPAVPLCREGDAVKAGDLIGAIPEGGLGAAVHASVSGIVVRVDSVILVKGVG